MKHLAIGLAVVVIVSAVCTWIWVNQSCGGHNLLC